MKKLKLTCLMAVLCGNAMAANVLDSLKPGQWYEIPNSKLTGVAPSPTPPGYVAAVMSAWSGGSFDTKRNQLVVWGGGHGDYSGNEVYSFNVETLKWTRLTNPSTNVGGDETSGLYPDGTPRSRHTYNYVQYVPGIDRFCSFGASGMYPSGSITSAKTHCLNLDTKVWETKANVINPSIGAISGVDPSTGLVWMESAGQYSYLSSWNPTTNVWTKWANYDPSWFQYYSTASVGNKHFVAIGGGKVFDWDLNVPQNQVKVLATTGADALVSAYCPGFAFHPPSGKYIGWSGGTGVYALDLATKGWSKIALASSNAVTPTNQAGNGTFGRFQYIPSKDAFIVVNSVSENVYVFKYGTATVTPPPAPTQYAVTMAVGAGSGSVSPSASSVNQVVMGGSLSVAATAASGWHFKNWTVTSGMSLASANSASTQVTNVQAAGTAKAYFEQDAVTPPPATTPIYIHDTVKIYIKQLIKIIPNINFDTTIMYDTTSFSFFPPDPVIPPVVVVPPTTPPPTTPPPVTPPPTTPPVVVVPPPGDGTTRLLTTIKVKNTAAAGQGSVPVTFGQVLRAGDIKGGETLRASLNGAWLASQFDAKAAHNDGTVRHGVMSFILDTMLVGQEATVQLSAAPAPAAVAPISKAQLPSGFDAKLNLKVSGVTYSVSLASLVASPSAKTWLTGGEANEFIVAGPLKNASNAVDPHLNAVFAVRQYKKNVRVDLTLENTWSYEPGPTGYTYDVDYTVGGKQVLSQVGVKMPHQTRWRNVAWYGSDVKTALTFDKKYLAATGAFPYYDISTSVSEAYLAAMAGAFPLMSNGNINPYMPNTGAQDGIGPLPRWAATFLVSGDDRARRNALANGEAAGAYSIHWKDKNTGYPLTIDNYPYFTINGGMSDSYNPATQKYEMPPAPATNMQTLTPDDAHQPSLAYLPYAVSGDYFFLEEMQYWATWNLLLANPGYRGYAKGLLDHTQTRAKAWGMRTLAQAAYITPDSHPLKSYFKGKLDNNIAWFTSEYVGGPKDNKIGYYWDNAYAPYGFAPWQDNFLTFAIGYVNQLGFTNAKAFMDFKSKLSVSMMTDPGYCWLQASAYSLQHSNASGVPYANIGAIYSANFPSATGCSGAAMDGYPDSPSGYGANLQPALAVSVDNGSANAAAAWSKYQTRAPKQNYADVPQFNVIPISVLAPMLQ